MAASRSKGLANMEVRTPILENCLAGTLEREFKQGIKAVLEAPKGKVQSLIFYNSLFRPERITLSRLLEKKYIYISKGFSGPILSPALLLCLYLSTMGHSLPETSWLYCTCLLFSGFNKWRGKED